MRFAQGSFRVQQDLPPVNKKLKTKSEIKTVATKSAVANFFANLLEALIFWR